MHLVRLHWTEYSYSHHETTCVYPVRKVVSSWSGRLVHDTVGHWDRALMIATGGISGFQ
jgi:hypothetical protein